MIKDLPWKGSVRQALITRNWNVSDRTRTRWIERLDHASGALVFINQAERSVELKMKSSVDGISYCAGLYIKVDNFDSLYDHINSD